MDQISDLLSTKGIISCRIRFVREAPSETKGTVLKKFLEPQVYFAVKEDIPLERLLKNEDGARPSEEFHFLFLPDVLSTAGLEKTGSISEGPSIELLAKPNKIIWNPHRVVVLGSEEISEETFMALVEFAFFESELRKLESKLNEYFLICPNDIPLTHGVGLSDLRRQAHVNEMTRHITSSRMEFVRLIPCFDNLYGKLTPHTKRIIGELTEKTRVWDDRTEAVEDKLEFLEDLYELANDRLTEFRYFRKEFTLELWIIVLLVLELAVMLWEVSAIFSHSS